MILNKFFINVFIRVILILLSCIALGIALQQINSGYYYTLSGIIFLILLQTWLLINQVNRTNKDLEKFFSSVQDHDSSVRFQEYSGNSSFQILHERMNYVNTIIRNIKIEQERSANFLQNIVDHVDTGLISFDTSGQIEIYNRAAKRYLNLQNPKQISLLESKNSELFRIISSIRPGQEILHKITIDNLLQSIVIKAVGFKFDNKEIKLVSFQDITNELDKKEQDSWQKIIRVLTHEIMNSISPITSLTSVISGYFKNSDTKSNNLSEKIDDQIISKTLYGLNTIEETGKGLLDFVNKYRSLTLLPPPELREVSIKNLIGKTKVLMESCIPDNIKIVTEIYPDDILIMADFAQVEQVLINLLKNAVQAINEKANGLIQIKAFNSENSCIIHVEDNGTGISADNIEDIFVPFYTTKNYGSGIGLSLSRQIMHNHNGTITVTSIQDIGTIMTLKFQ